MLKFEKSLDFDEIYKDLVSQFPKEELKSYNRFIQLIESNYRLYKIYDKELIGYIMLLEFNDYIFIDYFAILKKFHSFGYGSKVLNSLSQNFKSLKGIFLEVEKANDNEINKIRRIKFYEKNNAKKLDVNYFYPTNDKNLCIPMHLYYISQKNSLPSKKDIVDIITNVFETIHCDLVHYREILNKCIK